MGWNPRVGQRVRIWMSVKPPPAYHRMTGRITGTWLWTRGNVRPFRLYNVRFDVPQGGARSLSVTRDALVFLPGAAPVRKKVRRKDSTRRRRRA